MPEHISRFTDCTVVSEGGAYYVHRPAMAAKAGTNCPRINVLYYFTITISLSWLHFHFFHYVASRFHLHYHTIYHRPGTAANLGLTLFVIV